jgi:tripartite-type tricarboxylate transporter receptor subunit TctC
METRDKQVTGQRRRMLQAAAALAAAGMLATPLQGAAQMQDYPARPIRMIVPFAAGGTSDVVARIVSQKLSTLLGQQIVVDNRAGANGNIGTDAAAKSPPDGYTLLTSFDGTMAINPHTYRKLTFDPQKDFVPLMNVGNVPLIFVVHPSVKAQTIQEFIALAKAQPGGLFYSSAGPGSTGHLTGELFASRAGIKMVHVPYKGGAPAVQDVVAGQIQMLVTALPTVEGHLKNGKLRVLAVSSASRMPSLPDVPTLAESGLPGFNVLSWYGIFAPAGTPRPIVDRLNAELRKAVVDPEVAERFKALGIEPLGGSPEDFAKTLREDTQRWAAVVKEAAISLD